MPFLAQSKPAPRPGLSTVDGFSRTMLIAVCIGLLAACRPEPLPPEFGRIAGLQIEDTRPGEGEPARAGDRLRVHYRGFVFDQRADGGRGPKFDESYARGKPFEFVLGAGQVIRGWDQGFEGLRIGGGRTLRMGPEFGYGERGAGSVIPPGASLLFDIELLGIDRGG